MLVIILAKHALIAVMDDESNDIMLEGARSKSDGMWHINLENGDKAVDADHNTIKSINGKPINNNYNTIKLHTRKSFSKPLNKEINLLAKSENMHFPRRFPKAFGKLICW